MYYIIGNKNLSLTKDSTCPLNQNQIKPRDMPLGHQHKCLRSE